VVVGTPAEGSTELGFADTGVVAESMEVGPVLPLPVAWLEQTVVLDMDCPAVWGTAAYLQLKNVHHFEKKTQPSTKIKLSNFS